jgi:hypothetical protein
MRQPRNVCPRVTPTGGSRAVPIVTPPGAGRGDVDHLQPGPLAKLTTEAAPIHSATDVATVGPNSACAPASSSLHLPEKIRPLALRDTTCRPIGPEILGVCLGGALVPPGGLRVPRWGSE